MTKRRPARQVAVSRGDGECWIDHAEIAEGDGEWLQSVRWLTLWNVTVPPTFLATLPALQGLDLRGGTATDLQVLTGCSRLRCLVVNQIRGLSDLSVVASLVSLELLHLYGLASVIMAPSLASLSLLRRLEVGLMRNLPNLDGLLDAPGIVELLLLKWVNVNGEDVARIKCHPTIASFDWLAEDVPDRRWVPVLEELAMPKPPIMRPEEWFRARNG